MSPHDIEYYRERAVTERARARSAARADVAAIHRDLARLYERLVEVGQQPEPAAVGSQRGFA